MNSSGKFLAPSVTAGFPAPGLPAVLLLLPPPQAATPTLSTPAAARTAAVRRMVVPLTSPPVCRCRWSSRRRSRRRLQPRVVLGPPVGRAQHRRLPAQSPRREQALHGAQPQVDEQREGGDP